MARRRSYDWLLQFYGKPCVAEPQVIVEWYPGIKDRILAVEEPLWRALGAIFLAYGYVPRDADTGAYNCRPITGGTRPSPHSWPTAEDVNWKTNPYIKTPTLRTVRWGVDTDMPAAMVAEIESITASGVRAFEWGGRWRTIKDPMHYENRVTPAEIGGGVYAPRGFYGKIGDQAVLRKGDKGAAVKLHQEGLLAWNPDALPEWGADSDYGDETETWVKLYQKAADLDQTGTIDGVTSSMVLRYLPVNGGTGKHTHPASVTVTEATKATVKVGENK